LIINKESFIMRLQNCIALLVLISKSKVAAFTFHSSPISFLVPIKTSISSPNQKSLEASKDENGMFESLPEGSRLQGNIREPTPKEISIIDDMITKLSQAKPYELPNAVSKAIRVISSPRFFLRIAERSDMATTTKEKEQLSSLAENLVQVIQAVVSTTEEKLNESAINVENVVKAAAEPDSGEFLVPLIPERIESMRKVLTELEPEVLDEGFLSTVDAWMNKSLEDGMDGMVDILQKVLQIYAGTQISRARLQLQGQVASALTGESQQVVEDAIASEQKEPTPASELFEELLNMNTEYWDSAMRQKLGVDKGKVSASDLMFEVQRTIEGVVLGLENGSMAQRVQAEYLRELVTRIEALK